MKKGRNSGGKDEEGPRLWRFVTRSVRAYAPSKAPQHGRQPAVLPPARPAPLSAPPPVPPSRQGAPAQGFDRATETKLRRGRLPLEGRIDLHGMTQGEAFAALQKFLPRAAAEGKRTLLVITGKGREGGGALRRLLPLWMEEPSLKKLVLAVSPAAPKDGGTGAFYIRLRKPKAL